MSLIEHLLPYIPVSLLKIIYPLKDSNRTRDRPLKLLCLGPGRTGTDSLRNALLQLGLEDVYHGLFMVSEAINDLPQWERLNRAKLGPHPDPAFLNKQEFDKVLGSSMALADVPCVHFGPELLRAYPEAKVLLNRRSDVDVWYESQLKTIAPLYRDWASWLRQWFDAETFWIVRNVYFVKKYMGFDFERNGKEFYARHYEGLEEELRRQGRGWVDWTVEDGWEPICELLGVEVPESEFPKGNTASEYNKKRASIHAERERRAFRNMGIAATVTVCGVAIGCYWWSV